MSKKTPYGWARADGSFRREAPDNPVGWTPLYTAAPNLYAALMEVEWAIAGEGVDDSRCPCCGMMKKNDHITDCPVRTALEKVRGDA